MAKKEKKEKKEKVLGELFYWKVPLEISVIDALYASSATSIGGIVSALKKNMPTETQIERREKLGEPVTPVPEIQKEIEEAVAPGLELTPTASTVFRRDDIGPYIHANYIMGHLKDQGKNLAKILDFWALEDFVTRTVFPAPKKVYLDQEIWLLTSPFTADVRQKSGATVKQSTVKTEEFVEGPVLRWTLYLLGDPRWSRDLLETLLVEGSLRGIGTGRGKRESQYTFKLGEFERVARPGPDAWGRA